MNSALGGKRTLALPVFLGEVRPHFAVVIAVHLFGKVELTHSPGEDLPEEPCRRGNANNGIPKGALFEYDKGNGGWDENNETLKLSECPPAAKKPANALSGNLPPDVAGPLSPERHKRIVARALRVCNGWIADA